MTIVTRASGRLMVKIDPRTNVADSAHCHPPPRAL
jgi:hypothetical protein